MSKRVCPWWLGYLLACPLRRWGQDPAKILSPYVREGMTVLEPGPGMGFFTVDLARMVGRSGRVIAVDVQEKMLASLRRRLQRAGLAERVDARLATSDSLNLPPGLAVDFTLAFAVVHELPSQLAFFQEVAQVSKPGAAMLVCEPKGHVKAADFEQELKDATQAGWQATERLQVSRSHSVLLRKS